MRNYRPNPKKPKADVRPCDRCNCLQKHTLVLVEVKSNVGHSHYIHVPSWQCNVCGKKG